MAPHPRYPALDQLMMGVDPNSPKPGFEKSIIPYLIDIWLTDYLRTTSSDDIIEAATAGFSYLFDIASERLISAWGISAGRHGGARDKSRMAGHPLSAGSHYHRGHAIPHTLGGPTDINLVPQAGRINIGPFRPLEKQAVATPGSLYFTYWIYVGSPPATDGRSGQTPTGVDQGLLIPQQSSQIITHGN